MQMADAFFAHRGDQGSLVVFTLDA